MSKPFIATETEDARSKGDRKATEILKDDHAKVKELFEEFRALEDGDDGEDDEKQRLFDEIDHELSIHATVEEEIFYPAVKALDTEEPVDEVLEAQEEHLIVKTLLGQLRGLAPGDETFDPKMKVLMEAVEHHADEEEKEMFSSAKKGLGDEDLLRLGTLIGERKRSLENGRMARPAARAADAPRPQAKRPTAPARKR